MRTEATTTDCRAFDVRWVETMRGRVVPGADVYRGSSARDGGVPIQFRVFGTIHSLERFRLDPEHRVQLSGWVSSELIGGRHDVEAGSLSLFAPTGSTAVAELTYRLRFHDASGQPYLLSGYKTVRDDRGIDLWTDTSRLDVTLHAGRRVSSPAVARGVMRISVFSFLVLFITMRVGKERVEPGSPPEIDLFRKAGRLVRRAGRQVWCRIRFDAWFLWQLAGFYGNPFIVKAATVQIRGDRVGRRVRAELQEDMDFEPQSRVRWADPRVLVNTALSLRRSTNLGDSIDVRQLQHPDPTPCRELSRNDELWVDFIADTGDGFAASYCVAYTAARETLRVGNRTTHRGRALVLGGDLVYPTPTQFDYDNRLVGPFAAALPWDDDEHHVVFAIPGNHDWYDNLKWFTHYFMVPTQWLGGRRVVQHQSYFALELPHRWWVLGVDIALDLRVDDRQVAFFEQLRCELESQGARVILVIAKPAWLQDPHSNEARNLQYIEQALVPEGALAAVLCGDIHHYARYGNPKDGPARICCGGGGAYTSGTHHLPMVLPAWCDHHRTRDAEEHGSTTRPLTKCYPSRADSARARRGVITALVRRLSFVMGSALVLLLLVGTLLSDDVWEPVSTIDELRNASPLGAPRIAGRALVANPIALVIWVLFTFALVRYAWSGRTRAGRLRAFAAGVLHVAVQLFALVLLLWLLLRAEVHGALSGGLVIIGVAVLGSAVAAVLGGCYLYLTDLFGLHPDHVFAVQGRTDFKSFLRLHVRSDGDLEIFVYGIPEIVSMWRINDAQRESAPVHDPKLVPTNADRGPFVELVERLEFRGSDRPRAWFPECADEALGRISDSRL